MWQANAVRQQLELKDNRCEIVAIESTGDIELHKPIYELGITASVFTKRQFWI